MASANSDLLDALANAFVECKIDGKMVSRIQLIGRRKYQIYQFLDLLNGPFEKERKFADQVFCVL